MKHSTAEKKIGLVLTGGGARAAYQVGVLRAIAEITGLEKSPFSVISGFSAGALNGAWLASRKDSFTQSTQDLWDVWASLTADKIFDVDAFSLGAIALRWVNDRALGGLFNKKKQITYLLGTAPLKRLVQQQIDFEALNDHIDKKIFHAVAFSATDYRTGHSVAFYNGSKDIKDWKKLNRMSVRTRITENHVLASAAIPIFFPPVRVGKSFYGDGMIRLNSPLSSAVRLGAEKLLVIGIRGPSSTSQPADVAADTISIGEIAGTILNGLFYDSLDSDLDRLKRINRTLAAMTQEERAAEPDHLREISVLQMHPLKEIGEIPRCELSRLPSGMVLLLKGIGVSAAKGSDLLSYLAFEPHFLKHLLDSGYEDTMKSKDQILEFFEKR